MREHMNHEQYEAGGQSVFLLELIESTVDALEMKEKIFDSIIPGPGVARVLPLMKE